MGLQTDADFVVAFCLNWITPCGREGELPSEQREALKETREKWHRNRGDARETTGTCKV